MFVMSSYNIDSSQRRLLQTKQKELASQIYHSIFEYELIGKEKKRWIAGEKLHLLTKHRAPIFSKKHQISQKERRRVSMGKLSVAKSAARNLSVIPTIRFIGVTGSLAMKNAGKGSDIDLMIITKKDTLWTTRLVCFFLLRIHGYLLRRAGEKEKDNALCLNIWMDETDLEVTNKNVFTAHELAQIIGILNRGKTHEKLISKNSWLLDYWPNAVEISKENESDERTCGTSVFKAINPIARALQWGYMEHKRTREVITQTRAFFHPKDWSREVIDKLKKWGVKVT